MNQEQEGRPVEPGASASSADVPGGEDEWRAMLRELTALRLYAGHFVAAVLDRQGLRLRRLLRMLAVFAMVILLAAVSAVAFTLYFIRGVAGGLSAAVESAWLGQLLTGALGLALMWIGVRVLVSVIDEAKLRRRAFEYEARKAEQRLKVGEDVDVASRAAA